MSDSFVYAHVMSSSHLPPDVTEAVATIDQASVAWPVDLQLAWRKVRGFVRTKQRESQRLMPAVGLVAQEVVHVRDHAQAALDAMSGVFGQHGPDEPETERLKKLPEHDGEER